MRVLATVLAALLLLVLEPEPASVAAGEILVVNSAAATDDGACDATHCTLVDAIRAANQTEAADVIHFDIPGDGPHIITPPFDLSTGQPVTIDATTQPGYDGSPVVEISGELAPKNVAGLTVFAGSSTIRGFAIYGWSTGIAIYSGSGNTISDNYIGVDSSGSKGPGNGAGIIVSTSGNFILRNVVAASEGNGVSISGDENVIQGNRVGTDATGTRELGNGFDGVLVHGANNLVGGAAAGEGNLLSANGFSGVRLSDDESTGNRVQGNLIGTDITGTVALGNVGGGIWLSNGADDNQVGGAAEGEGNLISGNLEWGIEMCSAEGENLNRIQGNTIGAGSAGNPLGNAGGGVLTCDGGNFIGGTLPGEGNHIAYNGGGGVASAGDRILGNSIHDNGLLGISLSGDSTFSLPNDPGDLDGLQNYPVLDPPAGGLISGSLDSTPATEFRIELFASPACDPSGHGEGAELIVVVTTSTDQSGRADFEAALPLGRGSGAALTATATGEAGETSEFSGCSFEAAELFEGWNEVAWVGSSVSGAADAIAALDAAVDPPVWESVARYEAGADTWLQTFREAPLPAFNTLTSLDAGADYWLFVSAEAVLAP